MKKSAKELSLLFRFFLNQKPDELQFIFESVPQEKMSKLLSQYQSYLFNRIKKTRRKIKWIFLLYIKLSFFKDGKPFDIYK